MEEKTSVKEIPVKLHLESHLDFVNWVSSKVHGVVNHYKRMPVRFGNLVPDVCVIRDNKLREMHEVEVVKISRKKIQTYSLDGRPKSVLWLCVSPLGDGFDEVNVVCNYSKPDVRIASSPIMEQRKAMSNHTTVWIKCRKCGAEFDSIAIWVDHLDGCEGF